MKFWTNERIEKEILVIANQFDPPRMPTRQETATMYKNEGLSNAISKHGGYKYWADKLGLEQTYSETFLGVQGESYIANMLESQGFRVEVTTTKHPYDLLVNECVKVDVKTANTSFIRGCPVHAYRLAKRQHTCDFYIFYEADTGKIYVVPAHECKGQVQVEMGNNSKPYIRYFEAYDLIQQLINTYEAMSDPFRKTGYRDEWDYMNKTNFFTNWNHLKGE